MKLTLLLALTISALSLPASVIYQQDFEASTSLPTGFSGAGAIESTGGFSAFGLGSNHLRNAGTSSTQLSLTGLAAHSTITVSYDLVVWDSADAFTDALRFDLDTFAGETVIGNYGGGITNFIGPGTLLSDPISSFSVPNYGQNSQFRDQARRVVRTLSHTASSATIQWSYPSSQGGTDESFGLDNILIEINSAETSGVPEPSTFVLAAGALALLKFAKRR